MGMVIAGEESAPRGSAGRRNSYDARAAQSALLEKANPQFLELLVHTVALEMSMIPPKLLNEEMSWLKEANAGQRAPGADRVLKAAEKEELSVREFARLAVRTFKRSGRWQNGGKQWGGDLWAQIAEAILMYDQTSPVLWLDHVFDLEHNHGAVFSGKRLAFKPIAAKELLDYKRGDSANPAEFVALAKKFDVRVSPKLVAAVAAQDLANPKPSTRNITWFSDVKRADSPIVGGKGANLGEMHDAGLPVPPGYVVTVNAFRKFLTESGIGDDLERWLGDLDVDDAAQLRRVSKKIQTRIQNAPVPDSVRADISQAYQKLGKNALVAVRSSGTVEDGAEASFAGMFRSHLNVRGVDDLIRAVKDDWASAFGERILAYAKKQGSAAAEQLVAVVVMKMVQSEKSGVLFTTDPTSGKKDRLVIESTRGLGEAVVSGEVVPDRVVLSKRNFKILEQQNAGDGKNALTKSELRQLSALAAKVERHYGAPQDIEFAFERGKAFLVQTRPITKVERGTSSKTLVRANAKPLVRGIKASSGTVTGRVRIVHTAADARSFRDGEILVADMTLPDWVPIMMRAKAIVTDNGGVISHAAIVARELGVPAVVGTHDATQKLSDGMLITVDGQTGTIYQGNALSPAHGLFGVPTHTAVASLLQWTTTVSSSQESIGAVYGVGENTCAAL